MARTIDGEAPGDAPDAATGHTGTALAVAAPRAPRRAAWIATLIALPITVLAAFAFTAGRGGSSKPTTAPITLAAIPANPAGSAACTGVLSKLPIYLGSLAPRRVFSPSGDIVAWGDPPVILRCGVPRPASLQPGDYKKAILIGSSGAEWDFVTKNGKTVWTSLDRAVYVEVTVPSKYPGDATMSPISAALAAATPAVCRIGATVPFAQQCAERK